MSQRQGFGQGIQREVDRRREAKRTRQQRVSSSRRQETGGLRGLGNRGGPKSRRQERGS